MIQGTVAFSVAAGDAGNSGEQDEGQLGRMLVVYNDLPLRDRVHGERGGEPGDLT